MNANADIKAKLLLRELLQNFEPRKEGVSNEEYLDEQLKHLETVRVTYRARSSDARIPARLRARARDLEQNAAGLINGIKFGISFILHKDEQL